MSTRLAGIPDYRDLDPSGEAQRAAQRMEARAREPASEQMFEALVRPLLEPRVERVLELGCGSGALARRVARALPHARVDACDKSGTMLSAAQASADGETLENLHHHLWDITREHALEGARFDLILSSVTVPYLTDEETEALVGRCARLLAPGGRLAFIEQDLLTDAVHFPDFDLFRRVYARDGRRLKRTLAHGLRPLMREAGLLVAPRASFLWTDDAYGPYVRDLLGKTADDALAAGRISPEERAAWGQELARLAEQGDFYYGLVYHRLLGARA